jgi:hypothetical protein
MTSDYPTRGFNIVQPSIAETQLTGWVATAQFSRLGHEYAIKFIDNRMPRLSVECMRDGKPIAWHRLSDKARQVAHKAADFLKSARAIAAA